MLANDLIFKDFNINIIYEILLELNYEFIN
jgi:hypothetical protein